MAKSKKEMPELNGAGMSDISFLLLSFFLMTSNMDQTSGLQRRLPAMPPENQEKTPENEVKRRNVFQVRINQWDAVFAGGSPMDLSMLREEVKSFILNPTNDPNKSEKIEQDIKGLGKFPVSEAVISLQNDRGTGYEVYIKVQNEIVAAYNEIREDFSRAQFNGRSFESLTEEEQDIVRDVFPQRISEAEPKDISAANTRRRR
ncbi:MAG: biopolymer transporter ExbD [Prevotellaceae bacterium]|jgi:biopolymer transport protein ExbD|nr:biopolymer transporter ExbD [Prevotellaceae bacterium]